MRSVVIVDVAPLVVEEASLANGVEYLAGKELVPRPAVEGLDPGVLPRAAGVDVGGLDAIEAAPIADGGGDELGAVVAPDEAWRAADEERGP